MVWLLWNRLVQRQETWDTSAAGLVAEGACSRLAYLQLWDRKGSLLDHKPLDLPIPVIPGPY